MSERFDGVQDATTRPRSHELQNDEVAQSNNVHSDTPIFGGTDQICASRMESDGPYPVVVTLKCHDLVARRY